jgi:H+/Cl- antiporter ClcA
MAREMSGSDDGDVVIGGLMAEASMESTMLGMAVTPTAVVLVATMTVFGAVAYVPLAMMVMAGAMTGSYGLLAPAMSRLASPTWSAATGPAIRVSRPRADSPAHRLRSHDAMSWPRR